MAKRRKKGSAPGPQISKTAAATIEDFAEDLGRLLGSARAKAEGWLGQRQNVSKQLEQIRDTASELLGQLSGYIGGRQPRRPGRRKQATRARTAAAPRRKLSAKARRAISLAQKRRWAKLKRQSD